MKISSFEQARGLLDDPRAGAREREAAVNYLASHPGRPAPERLVEALQDEDFGVRWEAAAALSGLGRRGLIPLLLALMDPQRVGDARLREGAYHVLHYFKGAEIPFSARKLMAALKSPGADIASMGAAFELLKEIQGRRWTVSLRRNESC